ncbi:MAG: hypothetical protein RRC34_10525 [Lentisphaeria bacterium]|nr:hypothetical protein [Lentisphaeria bacterium]
MTDKTTSQPRNSDTTPDAMMDAFKGRGLKSIILFTVIIHVIVLGGTSIPYVLRELKDTTELSEEERVKLAIEEATPILREIADKYGLNPQQLSSQFAGGGSRAAKLAEQTPEPVETPGETTPAPGTDDTNAPDSDPERPKSALEKELDVKLDGPKQPSLEDEKDIF